MYRLFAGTLYADSDLTVPEVDQQTVKKNVYTGRDTFFVGPICHDRDIYGHKGKPSFISFMPPHIPLIV